MNGESRFVDGSAHGRSIMTPARISNDNYRRTVNVLELLPDGARRSSTVRQVSFTRRFSEVFSGQLN